MDPRRLLIFREVAHRGSFAAAARALGWTQPAVSQHMSALERECGHPLLLRGRTGVVLTEAGRLLAARADTVAATLSQAAKEQHDFDRLATGTLRLAAFPSATAAILPAVIARLRRLAPGVELRFVAAEPEPAHELLERDEVDAALVFSYDREAPATGFTGRAVLTDPIRLVLPADRPCGGEPVGSQDLGSFSWIAGCDRCRGHLLRVTAAAGFEPRITHSTDDYVATQHLVAAGLGVALLPQAALDAFTHPGVQVDTGPRWGTRRIDVHHRDGAESIPAVRALLHCIPVPGAVG